MSTAFATMETPVSQQIPHIAFGAPVEDVAGLLRDHGAVVLDDVLSPTQLGAVNRDVDAIVAEMHAGSLKTDEMSQEFHGRATKRVGSAVALSKTFREDFVDSPHTRAYVTEAFRGVCETYWLQASQIIEILPGEKEQPLHRDMYNYPAFAAFGAAAPEVTVNMLLALVDTTEANGATRVIPGSHEGPFQAALDEKFYETFTPEMTVPAELKAGSALFFSGRLVHGGGANKTTDQRRRVIATSFNPGFLVPEDAYPFIISREEAATYSPTLQQVLGFRSFHQRDPVGGSLWQVDYEELSDFLKL
jgi:ectoine hydroxylase-related dioxygenase (phytanoyl-CoA dioxygenase family)